MSLIDPLKVEILLPRNDGPLRAFLGAPQEETSVYTLQMTEEPKPYGFIRFGEGMTRRIRSVTEIYTAEDDWMVLHGWRVTLEDPAAASRGLFGSAFAKED